MPVRIFNENQNHKMKNEQLKMKNKYKKISKNMS